jgi:enterochelin esterase-like enzyme
METEKSGRVLKQTTEIESGHLERNVKIDFYFPPVNIRAEKVSLLLINDGQDMERVKLETILDDLFGKAKLSALFCVAIHAGPERKMEYGTAAMPDYKGRGAKARDYTRFIFEELLPYVRKSWPGYSFKEKAFAGFSLGALSALDIVWNHPIEFSRVGAFSGSFWWRSKDKNDLAYDDATDRIMHKQIRDGGFYPWLRFFFECGAGDEEYDRNNNGIIDSIDDTLDLMKELEAKGYDPVKDIRYVQLDDGKHDVETWARALPDFLQWGWGR